MNIKFKSQKWSRKEILSLLERLSMYIIAGLSVNDALNISKSGMKKTKIHDLDNVTREVESGGLVSRALAKNIGISKIITGLIIQGETTGSLGQSLQAAHTILEREDDLIKKCISAMMYPFVIGICASLLTFGLVRGVIPQIIPLLTGMHVELPLLTKITIAISNGTVSYGIPVAISLCVFFVIYLYFYKRYSRFRFLVQLIISKIPIVGNLVFSYSTAVLLRSLGMLVSSGAPLIFAYRDVATAISFEPLKKIIDIKSESLEQGSSLSTIFQSQQIPSHVSPLIMAGELSGSLGESLIRASVIIERDIDLALKRLTSLIEPIMMVGMGGIVGSIALSIMLPIYDISKVLQHTH